MARIFPRLTLLVILLVFLASCSLPLAQNEPTPTPVPTKSSTAPVNPADVCPTPVGPRLLCLTPHSLRQAYGVEPLIQKGFTGKGQTVIDIVSFGSPTLKQDMEVYDKAFGLPPVDLQIISPINKPESDPHQDKSGWGDETTLDVQIIHAIAPDAKIVVLTSPIAETEGTEGLPEFRQLIQYAIDHKLGNIFSNSWGASELTLMDQAGKQELQQWDTLLQKATTEQGMTFIASSGDHGSTDAIDMTGKKLAHVPTTSFAAGSPWMTSVGGTTVTRQGSVFNERVWNDGSGASGGGFSQLYKMPDYQKTLPSALQGQFKNRRGIPDVAAAGDPNTGLAMYSKGLWTTAGGTSASTPVWAGLMA
ncbi:MAG: S53 family peptidase, partial [Ktedonobacteraceae bacterium]|nr:S53 family peptidase [Ktedonobacteraceae bacterium]